MNAKIIGIIVLLALLGIFAVENAQPVTIKFLFWDMTISAVLIILVSFLIGFLVGCLVMRVVSKKKKTTPNLP